MINNANCGSVNNLNPYQGLANTGYSDNKLYLAASYGVSQPDTYVTQNGNQYYDTQATEQKKKRSKIKTAAVIGAAALTVGSITVAALTRSQGKNLNNLLNGKNIKEVGTSLKNKFLSFMANINPVKDDLVERGRDALLEKKIPGAKLFDKYCTGTKNFYRNILYKFQGANYSKAVKVLEEQGITGIESFGSWSEKLNNQILESLKGKNGSKHFTEGLINKKLFSKMTSGNIADEVLLKSDNFRRIAGEIQLSPEQLAKLDDNGLAALESLNKTRGVITSKLRDINAGSAATDFMTMIASGLGLGIGIKAADSKQEKKSIAVNVGVPLITTLASNAFIGNIFAISGASSMLFSIAVGQVASKVAKTIDKHVVHATKDSQQV